MPFQVSPERDPTRHSTLGILHRIVLTVSLSMTRSGSGVGKRTGVAADTLAPMHVLIATAGVLDPEPSATFTTHLVGDDGRVSVITVIEVPRSFLDTIRSEQWHPLAEGERDWSREEDAVIARYVEERGHRIIEPVLAALRSRGIEADVHYLEGEDPAATIIEATERLDADVVVLGATKPLFDETAWESVSARVMRESERAVLVVPAGRPEEPDTD
jgi:nucleotide-binding universal stress UspA family protein